MSTLLPSGNVLGQDSSPANPLPGKFKTTAHLLCIFAPAAVFVLLTMLIVLASSRSEPVNAGALLLSSIAALLAMAAYIAVLYVVAGGFEWKGAKLPVWRIVVFWVLGDFLISLLAWGLWYFIRQRMAQVYSVSEPDAMGRLLRTGRKPAAERYYEEYVEKAGFAPARRPEVRCSKCGAITSLGDSYSFTYGKRIRSSTEVLSSTARRVTTYYSLSPTAGSAYLCNRCVALARLRNIVDGFKKTFIVCAVLTVLLFPVTLVSSAEPFLLPLMVLIFGSPIAIFLYLNLRGKEQASLQVYADPHNNPGFPRKGHENDAAALKAAVQEQGEKLAIQLEKPALTKAGWNAFFTHKEAAALTRE